MKGQPALVKKKSSSQEEGPEWTVAALHGLQQEELQRGALRERSSARRYLKERNCPAVQTEMFALTETYERRQENAGVEIRSTPRVTPSTSRKKHRMPPSRRRLPSACSLIKGMDGEQVVVVNELYRNLDKISDKVVVMGGGLAGCE